MWAGVVVGMVAIGAMLALLAAPLGDFNRFVLPAADLLLIVLGALLVLGVNPFARLPQPSPDAFGGRGAVAGPFLYGLLFAPIAVPCSGPFLVGIFAFSLTIGDALGRLLFFLAFGIGFGLPLFVLGSLGQVRGREVSRWLVRYERPIQLVVGHHSHSGRDLGPVSQPAEHRGLAMTGPIAAALVVALLLAACAAPAGDSDGSAPVSTEAGASPPWPAAPDAPTGPLEASVQEELDRLVASFDERTMDRQVLETVAASGDARIGWLLSDLLRFSPPGTSGATAVGDAFATLTGYDAREDERFGHDDWLAVTNVLIGWDLPAYPGYREHKAAIFLPIEPAWEPFFSDADAAIDWRWLSWGGVFIDDREVGDERPCSRGCIPALDDPALTTAAEGDWYADDKAVFGHRRERRGGRFPEAHHGGARDGQPDRRRATDRPAVLHPVRLGPGVPDRCGSGRHRRPRCCELPACCRGRTR